MLESSSSTPQQPPNLPRDPATRRLAIRTLAHRAVIQKREAQLDDVLGRGAAHLLDDLLANVADETTAQLRLSEHLLGQGWTWHEVLEAVWYSDNPLRAAALGE